MGKKSRNKKINRLTTKVSDSQQVTANDIQYHSKNQEAPVFWATVIIPIACLVGAWTNPPVATPMELKSFATQIYLSFLLLIWFLYNQNSKTTHFKFSSSRIAFGSLFLLGTVSVFWASNPDFWVYKWNKWYAGFAIFLLALHINLNEKNLRTIASLLTLAGLITAVIGISQYLFGFDQIPQTAFPSSTFGNANMAGQVLVLTGLFPLFLIFSEERSKFSTWFYAISCCLIFTFAFYTRTRAVWISCVFQSFLLIIFIALDKTGRSQWLIWSKNKKYSTLFSIVLFITLINFSQTGFTPFWEVAAPQIASISTSIGSSAAEGEHRYIIWTSTLEMLRSSPFLGVGLGNWFEAYNNGGFADTRILGTQRAHNDVLELGAELGILGILLLAAIIISICLQIYLLILKSKGYQRIFFALITIALTGSMLNAQVSFPYQLPVPLIITPFLAGLLINGAENHGSKFILKLNSPPLEKAKVFLCAVVFIFILINDALWFKDFKKLNILVTNMDMSTPWNPINPIYNQAYFTAGRSVIEALKNYEQQGLSENISNSLRSYWPNNITSNLMTAEILIRKGDLTGAEEFLVKTFDLEPDDSFIAAFFLMQIYQQTGQLEKLESLYDSMKNRPESLLSKSETAYSMLHSISINIQDFELTDFFYQKFIQYWGENSEILANQGIYYLNIGDYPSAVLSFEKALTLNPNVEMADQFRQFIQDYSQQ